MKIKVLISLAFIPVLMAGCQAAQSTPPATTQVQLPPTTQTATTTLPATTVAATTAAAITPTPTGPPTSTVKITLTLAPISVADLYNKYVLTHYDPATMKTASGDFQTVDARIQDEYNKNHIPATISIVPSQYGTNSELVSTMAQMQLLPKDVLLVFYDDNGTNLAPALAQQFLDFNQSLNWGFDPSKIVILQGGYNAWAANDYPALSAEQ